jgi:hypothetical protein
MPDPKDPLQLTQDGAGGNGGEPALDVVSADSVEDPSTVDQASDFDAAPKPTPRVIWKVVKLIFEAYDGQGFGHAYDPATRDEFLLNLRTVGFTSTKLEHGRPFQAQVTRAHFVEKIVPA